MPRARTILLLSLLAGCSGSAAAPRSAGPWTRPIAERERDPFPRVYTTANGESVTVARAPQRIVSGTILTDEVLLAICPRERIAALHTASLDPSFSASAADSAMFPVHTDGAAEVMLAHRPDLVFLASFSKPETRALLERGGVTVVRIDQFGSLEDIRANLRAIGWVLGLDARVEKLVGSMDSLLLQVEAGKERRRAWRVLHWGDGYTSGAGTIFDSMLAQIGAQNAALPRTGSAKLRQEEALLIDPDAIVVESAPGRQDDTKRRLLQSPAIAALRCVKNARVAYVDSALLASTSHHVALAAARIAEHLDRWGKP